MPGYLWGVRIPLLALRLINILVQVKKALIMEKKELKQVKSAMKIAAYTWKQVVKQVSGYKEVRVKDKVYTPEEAWAAFGVKSAKSVVKASNIKAAWRKELVIGEGASAQYQIRLKDSVKVSIGDKEYTLYDNKFKAVKYYAWHVMTNEADVVKENGDVKITADRLLDGLFDCKYYEDACKEMVKSIKDAQAVTTGKINKGDNKQPEWIDVVKVNGMWHEESDVKTATAVTKVDVDVTPVAANVKTA